MDGVSEKFEIKLRIGSIPFSLTIRRIDEEMYRNAEKMINKRLNHYSSRFLSQDNNVYMAMTLLDLALSLAKSEARNDTKPLEECMQEMLQQIDQVLKSAP